MNTEQRTKQQRIAMVQSSDQGVGARQGSRPSPHQGGGYLQTYRFCEFEKQPIQKKSDPRLLWLRQIGLNATMQKIAAEIGVDNFIKVWTILELDESAHRDSGTLTFNIRSFKAYRRFERKRLIKALAASGKSNREITEVVAEQLGEKLHQSYILRLSKR